MFFAWAWLRHDALRWFDWLGLAALGLFTYLVPGSRGAAGAMAVLLGLFAVQRFLPRLFDNKVWYALRWRCPWGWRRSACMPGMCTTPNGRTSAWPCCC